MRKLTGFTLLEVLIAMTMISIALTAIIKAASQSIRDTAHIEEKVVANWVGLEVMNEVKLNLIKLPPSPSSFSDEMQAFNKQWRWQADLTETPNPKIKEVNVKVFRGESKAELITLTSYKYVSV